MMMNRIHRLTWSFSFSKAVEAFSHHRAMSTNAALIKVSEEVRFAVGEKKPVVALESTIYTHGFPYPENVELASHLESVVRVNGGIPATIGVLNGVARVGLDAKELDELTASTGKPETRKLSRRDLGFICGLGVTGRKLNGGTTIAGTMILAHLAGIKIFATGGLGGVHRGGENSLDISADLTELGRTPVAVISSGCKSFLDIPRTLEYLETQGVGVGTFADGREGPVDFPAFWTRDSGVTSPMIIRDEKEAAAVVFAQLALNLSSGLLFGNPIGPEYSIHKSDIDSIIAQAVEEADKLGLSGSRNTPFILKKIRELTQGHTVTANRSLIEGNVARGTRVAVELAKLERNGQESSTRERSVVTNTITRASIAASDTVQDSEIQNKVTTTQVAKSVSDQVDVVIAGSLAIDLACDFTPLDDLRTSSTPTRYTSNPARISQSIGGVGQNIAMALHTLGTSVRLCSAVANDVAGITALELLKRKGLETDGIIISNAESRTAQYVAVNDAKKDLFLAMADMNILEERSRDFDVTWRQQVEACRPKWLVMDGNWDPATLRKWTSAGKAVGARVAFEPVSVAKSARIFVHAHNHGEQGVGLPTVPNQTIDLATPNMHELSSMHGFAQRNNMFEREDWWATIDSMGLSAAGSRDKFVSITNSALVDIGLPQQSIQLLPFIPCILTKLGRQGVLMTQILRPGDDRLTSPDCAPYIVGRGSNGNDTVGGVYMRLFPPTEIVPEQEVVSVNGVGDTFLGIILAGLASPNPKHIIDLIEVAQRGSVMTLKSKEAVSPGLSTLRAAL